MSKPKTTDQASVEVRGGNPELAEFLEKVAAAPGVRSAAGRGRLIFSLDATLSREPSWDRACQIQGEMFEATEAIGGLDVQMVYFRGFRECRASGWVGGAEALLETMTAVSCRGGRTQIGRVFRHALKESAKKKVNALVYVGDAMEENVDALCSLCGELGLRGVPVFVFQEGDDPMATTAYQEFARLTGGAHCRFDSASASELRELLSAVAVFAAGGRPALEHYSARVGGATRRLSGQLR